MPGKGKLCVERLCAWCGARFAVNKSTAAAGQGLFHTRACYVQWVNANPRLREAHPRWKGDEQHARGGRERARLWFSLTGRVCAECEAAPAAERHHWDGNTLNNAETNVVFLCTACHHRLHRPSHCKYGHPFSGANLRLAAGGRYVCRACESDGHRRKRARAALRAAGVIPPHPVPPGIAALIRVRYATGNWSHARLRREYGLTADVIAAILARTLA